MRRAAAFIDQHLLVCLSLCYIAGIAAAPLFRPSTSTIRLLGVWLLLLLPLLATISYRRSKQAAYCLLLPLFAGIGFYAAEKHLQVPSNPSHLFQVIEAKTEAVIVGTLSAMPAYNGESTQFPLATEFLRREGDPELQEVEGTLLLRLPDRLPRNVVPGDRLVVRANVKRPEGGRSPGAFDYPRYLAEKDIWVTGFVRSAVHLHRLDEPSSWGSKLRYYPEKLRTEIGDRIDGAVAGRERGIYRAILIGDYSQVDDATMEAYKASGTFHILSVSGAHMAVIGAFLYLSMYWLLSRSEWLLLRYPVRKIAAFSSLPVLIFYSLLTGLNAPVLRAVIMSGVVITALCTDRRKFPSTVLAFAAIAILAVDPLQLFTASFQLSFAAVLAILFLYPALRNIVLPERPHSPLSLRQKFSTWLVAGILVSVVATLATAPITLYFFNRFSVIGIVANLLVEPLVCLWSLPAGFLAIPLHLLAPEASDFCLEFGSIGLKAALSLVNLFADLPGASLWLPSPALWLMLLYFAAFFALTYLSSRRNALIIVGLPALFGLFLLMILVPRLLPPKPPDSLEASFLDVGHGSSTLLQYPSGMNILIDGGGPAPGSSGSPSAGERIIAPFLWHKGIRRLDAVVITHPDADHYNGLGFILEHFSPTLLWVRDKNGHDHAFQELIRFASKRNISVAIPAKGQRLGNDAAYLECLDNLGVDLPLASPNSRHAANSGLILKACDGSSCTLFPGDIGKNEERRLIELSRDLSADLLLAPHHGSGGSNSPEFLSAVSPRLIVVSAGRSEGGRFPHTSLVRECERRRIPLFTTAGWGTLQMRGGEDTCELWGYARQDDNPLRPFHPILLHREENEQPGEGRAALSGQ